MSTTFPTGDFPTITASTYSSSALLPEYYKDPQFGGVATSATINWQELNEVSGLARRIVAGQPTLQESIAKKQAQQNQLTNMASQKRIVRVYLADVDDNIPLDKSVLYTGSEKLTDSTDQELYFEIPVQEILTKHNAYRATVVDKKATNRIGKEVFLEPVKIRDLKMIVVNIATF